MQSNIPLVSICSTTFNHVKFIESSLKGFLMQKTNFEFEILIHDDFSNDRTQEILRKFETADKRISVIYQEENKYSQGEKPLFKYLIPRAQGKYIALCEGDDYWTDPFKLQKQVDFLENNKDFVLSFHDVTVVNEKREVIKKNRIRNHKPVRTREELVKGAHIPTCTVLFRNLLKNFPKEDIKVKNGDTFLFSFLGHYGKGYRHFDIENAVYRVHSGGIWSGIGTFEKFENSHKTFTKILNISHKIYHKPLYRKLMSINYYLVKESSGMRNKVKYSFRFLRYFYLYLLRKQTK